MKMQHCTTKRCVADDFWRQYDSRMPQKGYAGQLIRCAIEQAKKEGRKGLVLTCKDKLLHYYENFGFVNEGVSKSVHGNVVWYQMRLTL